MTMPRRRPVSGLRESKKAATRSALARAAAEIALRDGAEGLTVAAITTAAGVSPRTFHNYFPTRAEALLEFVADQVEALVLELAKLPAELGLMAAVERIVVRNIQAGDAELDSIATLFRLGEIIDTLAPTRTGHSELSSVLEPLVPTMRPRLPGYSDFQAVVAIRLLAAAVGTALEFYYSTPEPRDPAHGEQLVQQAIRLVRLA